MTRKCTIFTTCDRPREYTDDLKTNIEQDLGVSCEIINLEDLEYYCSETGVDIFYGGSPLETDLVYIKHWHAFEEGALIVASFVKKEGKPVFPTETLGVVPKTKFGETMLLALFDLPVPDTVFYYSADSYYSNYAKVIERIGTPFIFKAIDGKKGANNYLVHDQAELQRYISEAKEVQFIAQRFIENDGDYRLINFGTELRIAIHRTREGDTHLNNTSQGGDGELVPLENLPEHVKRDSLRAANLLGRDISGIDVVMEKGSSKHYIFEVNYSPQLTTGTFLEVKRKELSDFIRDNMM